MADLERMSKGMGFQAQKEGKRKEGSFLTKGTIVP